MSETEAPSYKLILVAGGLLIVSIAVCVAVDLNRRRRIELKSAELAAQRAELSALASIDREVTQYRSARDERQRRIDLINRLKESQPSVTSSLRAWVWLARSPDLTIDSIAVDGGQTLHVNGRARGEVAIRALPTGPIPIDPDVVIPPLEPDPASLSVNPELEEILPEAEPAPTHFRMEVQSVKVRNRCRETAGRQTNCVDFILRLKVAPP